MQGKGRQHQAKQLVVTCLLCFGVHANNMNGGTSEDRLGHQN